MAIKIEKPLVIESTAMVDNQNIMVCFQVDQTIRLKTKGSDKVLTISIKDLFDYLANNGTALPKPAEVKPKPVADVQIPKVNLEIREYKEDEPLLNLNDFRSAFMVMPIPLDIKIKIEAKTVELLGLYKKRKADKADKREQIERAENESEDTEPTTAPVKKKRSRKS